MKDINVAITVDFKPDPQQSIFYNGGNQHCVFLYMLMKRLPFVKNVWLSGNMRGREISQGLLLREFQNDIVPLNEVIYETDLLIEMNEFIGQDHADVIRSRNGKLVAYRFGNEYFMSVESVSCGAHPGWTPARNYVLFDEAWTNPQHERTCKAFFTHLLNCPVHILPHLWSPYFVDVSRRTNREFASKWGYKTGGTGKRVGVFEPNLNVVKSSIIPMYAANAAYLKEPSSIKHIHITNTKHLIEHPVFSRLALGCKACTSAVATIDDRFPFLFFVAEHVDVVVSHQFENGLNYLFYEALHGGYPLVHNSPMLGNCGYYYEGNEIDMAADQILAAIKTHDARLDAAKSETASLLETVNPYSRQVQDAYAERVRALFA